MSADDGFNWVIDAEMESGTPPSGRAGSGEGRQLSPIQPGDRIDGRFELIDELGRGGSGAVYRARDLRTQREVALKFTLRSLSERERHRFNREGEVTAALNHPGIVRVHAAGDVDGRPYIAYELVEGGRTLRELLEEGVEQVELVRLLRDAALALGHAHGCGITHRDVKPENMLVDADARLRIADFGLARGEDLEALTKSGDLIGTPIYMAPEQFAGHDEPVGPRTDVWALGVVLHEVLTGERPFEGLSYAELVGRILQSDPLLVDASGIDPSLRAICLQALAKQAGARYSDGSAFAADLDLFLEGRPVSASSPGAFRRLFGGRRRRIRFVVGASLAALLSAALVASAWLHELDGGGELIVATRAFQQGEASRGELEAALATDSAAPANLRAAAHLALAERGEDWASRLAHAEWAVELQPLWGAAHLAEARALDSLGRYVLAADAYGHARAAGRSDLGAESRTYVRLEDWESAREPSELWLRAQPGDEECVALRVQILAGVGELDVARDLFAARQQALSEPTQVVLRALLSGGDARAELRQGLVAHPRHAELVRALALEQFDRHGDLPGALHTLDAARERGVEAVPLDLHEDLRKLLGRRRDLHALARAPWSWRRSAARWLIEEARREEAYALQASDPDYWATEPRVDAATLIAWARQDLRDAETIAPPSRPERSEAMDRLRKLEEPAPVDRAESDAARDRQRREAKTLRFRVGQGDVSPEEALKIADARLRDDPLGWDFLLTRGWVLLLLNDPLAAVRSGATASARCPRLYELLRYSVRMASKTTQIFSNGGRVLSECVEECNADTEGDRLTRATLLVLIAEFEGGGASLFAKALPELNRCLRERPGLTFARVMRAFALVRTGELPLAERDLELVERQFPASPHAAFFRALLHAKRGDPVRLVSVSIARARSLFGREWGHAGSWNSDDYPEIAGYRDVPAVAEFFRN